MEVEGGSRGVPRPSVFIVSTLLARERGLFWGRLFVLRADMFEGARPRRVCCRRRRPGKLVVVVGGSSVGLVVEVLAAAAAAAARRWWWASREVMAGPRVLASELGGRLSLRDVVGLVDGEGTVLWGEEDGDALGDEFREISFRGTEIERRGGIAFDCCSSVVRISMPVRASDVSIGSRCCLRFLIGDSSITLGFDLLLDWPFSWSFVELTDRPRNRRSRFSFAVGAISLLDFSTLPASVSSCDGFGSTSWTSFLGWPTKYKSNGFNLPSSTLSQSHLLDTVGTFHSRAYLSFSRPGDNVLHTRTDAFGVKNSSY